jgi:7-cyano-7-deazaguanine reductase
MGTKKNQEQHLGQKSTGSTFYDPTLLRRIERSEERKKLSTPPTFYGWDIWNGYEFTFLEESGQPRQYILKILYPAESKYLVESKSLKLYANSFAMTKCESLQTVIETIQKDLQELLECKVVVSAKGPKRTSVVNSDYLYENLDDLSLAEVNSYTRTPELLEVQPGVTYFSARTSSLRSNCKVTLQPDYGDLFVVIEGANTPTPESLLRYVISYRNENHFHEEIVEQIYQDLWAKYKPVKLIVYAQYTRRGGWDINPVRVSHPKYYEAISHLADPEIDFLKTKRQ